MIRRIPSCYSLWRCLSKAEVCLPQRQARVTCLFTSQKRCCHQQIDSLHSVKVLDPGLPARNDTFFADIKDLSSVQEIMTFVEKDRTLINSQHLSQIFVKLYHMAREQPSTVEEVRSDALFPLLCQHTLKHIRQFNRDEVFQLIRALCHLDVPLDSTLGQASLQMLRHFVNDLSLYQITSLDEIFKQKPSNPLLDALMKALPLAFQIKVDYELDPGHLWQVVNCLDMAIRHQVDITTIAKLMSVVYHKAEVFSKFKALKTVSSLSNLKPFPPNFKSAAVEVLKKLQFYVEDLSPDETTDLLLALCRAKHLHYPKLLNALSYKCCTESWDLYNTGLLLSVFNSHKFISTSVLNRIVDILKTNPDPLWEDDKVSLLTVFESLSEANQNVEGVDLVPLIRQCGRKLQILEDNSPAHLVKLAVHLAVLDCLPPELLERVFKPEFISKSRKMAAQKKIDSPLLQCYLILEQYARVGCQSNVPQTFLPPETLKEAIKVRAQVMKPVDLILQQFLEVGLGGPQFMLTGLWTKLGHFIDHLIVMRKEDFPVKLNAEESLEAVKNSEGFAFIEDVVLPENSKVLAVLVARQEWFNEDPPTLRGWMAFQQKCLAKLGYNPVIIGPPIESTDHIQDIDCCLWREQEILM